MTLRSLIVAAGFLAMPSIASAATGCVAHYSTKYQRCIVRCSSEVREFRKLHPCPTTGLVHGACPGWVVDHIIALECGGPDDPSNMQWQTTADAKAKDRWEGECAGLSRPPHH